MKKKFNFTRNDIQMTVVGLCLGLTMGILLVPHFDSFWCNNKVSTVSVNEKRVDLLRDRDETSQVKILDQQLASAEGERISEYKRDTSKFLPASTNTNHNSSKFRRPRYISTELDLRRKLIVGIVVRGQDQLEIISFLHRTLSRYVDKLVFFTQSLKLVELLTNNAGIQSSGIVLLKNESNETTISGRQELLWKAMKYFKDSFMNDYDFYFVQAHHNYYINGKLLYDTVRAISVSEAIRTSLYDSCEMEIGIILSRNSLLQLPENLTSFTETKTEECVDTLRNVTATQSHVFKSSSMEENSTWEYSITIGPVTNSQAFLAVHTYIYQAQKNKINHDIQRIQAKLEELSSKVSWPIGFPPSSKPRSRFDVLKWMYFTNESAFLSSEYFPNVSLNSSINIDQIDIRNMIQSSSSFLRNELRSTAAAGGHPGVELEIQFLYGYRRFDPARGMEYILDFEENNSRITYRVEGLRPLLGEVEIIPIPLAAESIRITTILPITKLNLNSTKRFLTRWVNNGTVTESKQNAVVLFMLLTSTFNDPSSYCLTKEDIKSTKYLINEFNQKVSVTGNLISKFGYVVISTKSSDLTSPVSTSIIIGIFDHLVRKSILQPNSLMLLLDDTNLDIDDEFLNRVRLNTIMNTQIFNPIPYVEFSISNRHHFIKDSHKQSSGNYLEIHKTTGYFQNDEYRYVSFYVDDYLKARELIKQIEHKIPDNLVEIFLPSQKLHILRAPEPNLKLRFTHNNQFNMSYCTTHFEHCSKRLWASKPELAKIILKSAIWNKS